MTTFDPPFGAMPVPQPEPSRDTDRDDERDVTRPELPPLLADWMRSRHDFTATVTAFARRVTHRVAWHGLRTPVYASQLAVMAPRGLWRITRALYEVLSDGQGHGLRVTAATSGNADVWLKLRKERNERIHRRIVVASTIAAPLALLVLALVSPMLLGVAAGLGLSVMLLKAAPGLLGLGLALAAPIGLGLGLPRVMPPMPMPATWQLAFAVVVVLLALGYIGRPLGKPLVKAATVLADNPGPLRAPMVMDALTKLGISGMAARELDQIRLLMDVARSGPGYQLDLELPAGVPASAVVDKRDKLSAALRRELGCVWPTRGKRHEGHLSLYVSDQPLSRQKQQTWPLLRDGVVDLFQPFPAFTDSRGRWVDVTLAYANAIIGAIPRLGKTFALRELLIAAGLDARARVYAIDGKGTGDLSPCALYAHFYSVGDEPEEIERVLHTFRALRDEMRRRARVIRELPRDECPESKVTSVLASRRDLRLEPIVIGIDETQVYFEDAQPKAVRDEFVALVTDLVKRGPALGIIVLMATQNVTANTIPTPISNNAVIRLCMKVFGWQAGDQILGTGSYKNGLDAQMFDFEDKGIGYLRSDGADARIVRTVHGLDAVASEKVALRARNLRIQAGRLSGDAADEVMDDEAQQVVLLDDVRQVFGAAEAMHLEDIAAGLAGLRPDLYGGVDARTLGSLLRGAEVEVDQVYVSGKPRHLASRKGVRRDWLTVSTTQQIGESSDDDDED